MANINDINKDYQDGFDCETEVIYDGGELRIYIDGRNSVLVKNIDKADACTLAEELLHKWDFSYYLEFNNEQEAREFIK